MIERQLIEALQKGVTAAVAASVMPTIPVAYLGRDFVPPDNQKWLEIVIIPNGATETWGDEKTYEGLMRLILHWPKNDEGVYEALDVLASIAGYFSKDRVLQNLRICETATLASVIDGGADWLFPAFMRYRSSIL